MKKIITYLVLLGMNLPVHGQVTSVSAFAEAHEGVSKDKLSASEQPIQDLPEKRLVNVMCSDTTKGVLYCYNQLPETYKSVITSFDGDKHSIVAVFKPVIRKKEVYPAVIDMTIINGELYILGYFEELENGTQLCKLETSEANICPRVAKLKENTWTVLPETETQYDKIHNLICCRNTLFVVVNNTYKKSGSHLYKYNDGKWSSVVEPIKEEIAAYTVLDNDLYIVEKTSQYCMGQASGGVVIGPNGTITTAASNCFISGNKLRKYNGSTWSDVNLSINEDKTQIIKMFSSNHKLYLFGKIQTTNDKSKDEKLFEFDGSALKNILTKEYQTKMSDEYGWNSSNSLNLLEYNKGFILVSSRRFKLGDKDCYAVFRDSDAKFSEFGIGATAIVYKGKIYYGTKFRKE